MPSPFTCVWITGGSSRLGYALARRYREAGAKARARNKARLNTATEALIRFAVPLKLALAREGIELRLINPGFIRTPLVAGKDFPMPPIPEASTAAARVVRRLEGRRFEIAFPERLAWLLPPLRGVPLNAWVGLLARVERRRKRR